VTPDSGLLVHTCVCPHYSGTINHSIPRSHCRKSQRTSTLTGSFPERYRSPSMSFERAPGQQTLVGGLKEVLSHPVTATYIFTIVPYPFEAQLKCQHPQNGKRSIVHRIFRELPQHGQHMPKGTDIQSRPQGHHIGDDHSTTWSHKQRQS